MSTICTICARGGSIGVPRKNVRLLHGKPLITYSIEQALACDFIDAVYVSTDDQEIADIARDSGAIVPFLRPKELADDLTSKLDVIQHLIDFLEQHNNLHINKIIDLDVTSPLRTLTDIKNCYDLLTSEVELVITGYWSTKNPYFNMVEYNASGFAELSKKTKSGYTSRQSSPSVYAMNGSVYIWHRHTLDNGLWGNQKIKLYEMPLECSIDIDTPIDWKLVEMLMKDRFAL